MNKKQKSGIILTSLAAIGIAGSLIAGSTYALFTSESKTNIAISSGTVEVSATIENMLTYTGKDLTGDVDIDADKIKPSTDYELANGQFMNGGTAEVKDGDLILEKVTPGDKVTFQIKVENKSNVTIKYRTVITAEEDNGLFSGLSFTIGENKFDGLSNKSKWDTLTASGNITTLNCEVNLPTDAGNKYQDKNCKISYTVEAVQGNAATSDPDENVIEIDNAAQLGFFRDIANKKNSAEQKAAFNGKTIKLTKNIDLKNQVWTPINWNPSNLNGLKLHFDGNNKTISNYVVNGSEDVGLFSVAHFVEFTNLSIDNATINGQNRVGAIVGKSYCTSFTNCNVTNSTIISSTWLKPDGEYDDGDKAGALAGQLNEGGNHITGCKVTNTTVKGYRDVGGLVGWLGGGNGDNSITGSTVKDCVIVNDRTQNPKGYTTDAQFDVHEIVGETYLNPTLSENTADNVTMKVIIADGFTKVGDSTYEISNENGFDYWADSINTNKTSYKNCTIKLTADIDYTDRDFTPINLHQNGGDWSNMVFDGGDHTISNVKASKTRYGLGIFSDVASSITIKNVKFDNIIMDGRIESGRGKINIAGVVIGYAYSKTTFENVNITNSKVYGFGKIGILVGMSADQENTMIFKNCTLSNNTISGAYNMGNLIGTYLRGANNGVKVTIENVNITDTTVAVNHIDCVFKTPVELTNATITCEEGAATSCLGNGTTISGQYTQFGDDGIYYGCFAKYYISYGSDSHHCSATQDGQTYTIADSEICVNSL